MTKIIKESSYVNVEDLRREFQHRDTPGASFAFPCDKVGNVLVNQMASPALENYEKCLNGDYDVVDRGVIDYGYTYKDPAVLLCDCGETVLLNDGWLNTCDGCYVDYNGGGQKLAPREQWGLETGESLSDILIDLDPEAVPMWRL